MPEQQERVIAVTLDSNETVYVRRLSPLATQLLVVKAEKLFPSPRPEEYVKPLSDIASNAVAGMTVPAEQNPAYQQAVIKAKAQRDAWGRDALIEMGVVVDTPEGRDKTIARYAERLAALAKFGDLPENVWLATVQYGLMTTSLDRSLITRAATGVLTGEEIRLALTTFRQDL